MADPLQSQVPGQLGHRDYSYDGGRDKWFTPNFIADTANITLIRNGSLESWSQGSTAGLPDAWEWNSVGTLDRTTTAYWGQYSMRVTKIVGDGNVTRVWQSVKHNPVADNIKGRPFTVCLWAKTDQGEGTITPYIYDGTDRKYGLSYSGSGEWEELWGTFRCPPGASPTSWDVGVQIEETASEENVYYYISAVTFSWGLVPLKYAEHYNDRAPICQHWLDDGTRVEVRGAMRAIPYMAEHTTVGGARSESFSVTMAYGCKEIIHVDTNIRSSTTTASLCTSRAHTYTTTGFQIEVGTTTGGDMPAAKDFVIDGVIWCIGWDDEEEQWK